MQFCATPVACSTKGRFCWISVQLILEIFGKEYKRFRKGILGFNWFYLFPWQAVVSNSIRLAISATYLPLRDTSVTTRQTQWYLYSHPYREMIWCTVHISGGNNWPLLKKWSQFSILLAGDFVWLSTPRTSYTPADKPRLNVPSHRVPERDVACMNFWNCTAQHPPSFLLLHEVPKKFLVIVALALELMIYTSVAPLAPCTESAKIHY